MPFGKHAGYIRIWHALSLQLVFLARSDLGMARSVSSISRFAGAC